MARITKEVTAWILFLFPEAIPTSSSQQIHTKPLLCADMRQVRGHHHEQKKPGLSPHDYLDKGNRQEFNELRQRNKSGADRLGFR